MTTQTPATPLLENSHDKPLFHVSFAWLALWGFLSAFAAFEVVKHGFIDGSLPYLVGLVATAVGAFIAPDLSFLVGMGDQVEQGSISPAAVPFYNAAHRMTVAFGFTIVAALSVALAGSSLVVVFVAGLSWMAHISLDRAVGYGLRNADGSRNLPRSETFGDELVSNGARR